MKKVLVGITLLVAGFSGLAKADDGLEAAEKLCLRLRYSDEQQKCMASVQKANFMDEEAVKVCGRLRYSDEIIKCVGTIKDMKYTKTAIQLCNNERYSDQIISCLDKSGRVGGGNKKEEAVDKAYVRSSLRKALNALKDRDSRKAEQIIENLIDTL